MSRIVPGLLALALLLTGCRTVWRHPEADGQRFAADQRACRGQAVVPEQGRWRDCMVARGWSPTVGFRWQRPFARE